MAQVIPLLITGLQIVTRLLRPLINVIEAIVFRFIYGQNREIPPITNRLLLLSATQLADRIRKKKVSCEVVMRAYQERLLEVNPLLNAMVDHRFDEAMEEAREADRFLLSTTKTGVQVARDTPLLGVPFTSKEAIAIEGLYHTSGLVSRKGIRAQRDAEIVSLYRKAGAIPYASTNISELCMWIESTNRLYGVTNNPHDLRRTCGGSSGGEGATIASAAGIVGIGNDLGGSIRLPAAFNGIFGHKPTIGVISNKGMYPPIKGKVDEMWQCGPLCRYAEDLLTIMTAVAGDDRRLKLKEKVDLKGMKVFYMEDDGSFLASATPDIKNAVKKAAAHFEKLGATVQKVNIPELKYGFELWNCKYIQSNPPLVATQMADQKGSISPVWEFLKWCLGCSEHTLPTIYWALKEDRTTGKSHHQWLKTLQELHLKMSEMLGENAVFLYPTQPEAAHRHHTGLLKFSNVSYTAVFNALGYPATHVPMGLSRGLPIGIQAVSGQFNDRLTIAAAIELERALVGGWISPGPVILKDD